MRADRGSVFTSKFWNDVTTLHGIEVQISGVESHNSIGAGERYHDPLRQIFDKIVTDHPTLDPEIALRLAVKAVNDTMGPEGIVPSLLVYGSLPTFPAVGMNIPEQKTRMKALAAAKQEMASITAKLRIQQALRSRLPPATQYALKPGDMVRVYRDQGTGASKKGDWTGPWEIVKICGKEVFVDWNGEHKHFNISKVIPDPAQTGDHDLERLIQSFDQFRSSPPPGILITEILSPSDP